MDFVRSTFSPQQNIPYLLVVDKVKVSVCGGVQRHGKVPLFFKTKNIVSRFPPGCKRKNPKKSKIFAPDIGCPEKYPPVPQILSRRKDFRLL